MTIDDLLRLQCWIHVCLCVVGASNLIGRFGQKRVRICSERGQSAVSKHHSSMGQVISMLEFSEYPACGTTVQ
jgi:hypothetical protein